MKKLMIAAAIVCAAALSHAAAIQWMAVGIMDAAGDTPYSGSATLTVWAEAAGGGSTTYSGACMGGMIMTTVGDTSETVDQGFVHGGDFYSLQFTMTDTDGNVYTSEKITGWQATFPSANVAAFTSGSWAAPEPTSGLLLLIGVAGLALKRKRA